MERIIDTNVNLSRWPFRRLPGDETGKLVAKLRSHNVGQAWAASFDGLLHRDMAGVNRRLADECRKVGGGRLVPFGSINPALPDWKEDIRRCHEEHQMPGIRLHPNYHGYTLDDPRFAQLLDLAEEMKLIVQLAITMEDERMQHPLLRVPHVDTAPLVGLAESHPKLRFVVLNAFRSLTIEQAESLVGAGQVYFDIAMLERLGGIDRLLRTLPLDRVLFGSHAPLFYVESAVLKLQESQLGGGALRAVCLDNARLLLPEPRS